MDTKQFNNKRLKRTAADEFYGLCLGVLADGVVNQTEADFLAEWLLPRIHQMNDPIIKHVYIQLEKIQRNGLNENSESELLDLLLRFTGATSPEPETNVSTDLPLCNPAPELDFIDRVYCFTGTFDFGSRTQCQAAAKATGATYNRDVTKSVDYLVIGNHATPEWLRESYGRKIIKAMEYRDKYGNISIVSEAHWTKALENLLGS